MSAVTDSNHYYFQNVTVITFWWSDCLGFYLFVATRNSLEERDIVVRRAKTKIV